MPAEALQCSKFKALVLSLFSHYVLFDRKSELYEDPCFRRVERRGRGCDFGRRARAIKGKARAFAASWNMDGTRFAVHREVVADGTDAAE